MCRSETHDQSRNFDAFDFFQFWIITTVFQVISKFREIGVIVLQTPSVHGESVTPHSGIFGVPRARPQASLQGRIDTPKQGGLALLLLLLLLPAVDSATCSDCHRWFENLQMLTQFCLIVQPNICGGVVPVLAPFATFHCCF